jgi:hypothetical protein
VILLQGWPGCDPQSPCLDQGMEGEEEMEAPASETDTETDEEGERLVSHSSVEPMKVRQ